MYSCAEAISVVICSLSSVFLVVRFLSCPFCARLFAALLYSIYKLSSRLHIRVRAVRFELFDLIRRTVMIGCLIFISNQAIRASMGLLLSLVFCIIYRELAPFSTSSVNALYNGSS